MNIATLKKSAIAALTVAVVVTGSLSATPAAAGGKHFGAGLVGGIALGLLAGGHRRGYREDRYYDDRRYYNRHCWYEYRWSHRHHREVRRKFCR